MQQPAYYAPKVVRIRRKGGVVVQGCDVYIGRAQTQGGWKLVDSIWHNPFTVKEYGLDKSLILYRAHILDLISSDRETWENYIRWLVSQGRVLTLGCWCKVKGAEPCHGDVIVSLCEDFIRSLNQ